MHGIWNMPKRKQISFRDIPLHEGSTVAKVLECFNSSIPDPVHRYDNIYIKNQRDATWQYVY